MSKPAASINEDGIASGVPTDGRHARRERGRIAVSDAMVDLVFEGLAPPSAEQVAARAGVSVASLFRYFETLDDLRHHTISRYFERFDHLLDIPAIGEGELQVRAERFAAARVSMCEASAPMSRLLRTRADQQLAAETINRFRATTADQIRNHFQTELNQRTKARRDDLVAVLNTLTSFEAWDQMHTSSGRSRNQIVRAWTDAVLALLV